jgi:hypothetical protein
MASLDGWRGQAFGVVVGVMAKKSLAEQQVCLLPSNLESRAILPGAWVPPAQAPIAGARPVASQRSEG